MTEKIFYTQPYLDCLDAVLISCEPCKEGFKAVLGKTVFFPRGGGQPCERGFIGDAKVLDVFESDNGDVVHIIDRKLEPGPIGCKIDLDMRVDHMQQHLGEHIFSAVISRMYGAEIIILRIEEDSSHIEVTTPLSATQLMAAQAETRRIIAADLPVQCYWLTPEQAKSRGVHFKAAGHEMIRVVQIADIDLNGCGGTHCESTAGVGSFLLCGTKEVRGNFRIYFKCGKRAAFEDDARTLALLGMQQLFDVETLAQLEEKAYAILERKNTLEEQCRQQKDRLLALECENLIASAEKIGDFLFVSRVLEDGNLKMVKSICDCVTFSHNAVLLFYLVSGGQASLVFTRSKGKTGPDMGEFLKGLMNDFGGKGGGSLISAQGMLPDGEDAKNAFFKISQQIKGQI